MNYISERDSKQSSLHSTFPYFISCPSRWSSTGSGIPQSSISASLNLNLDSPARHCHHAKQLGLHLQDQDDSSTQSTGQSHHEMASLGAGNSHGHYVSGQSGYDESLGRQVSGNKKSALSLVTPEFVFPSSKVDYTQSAIHPQVLGIPSTRVLLPRDFSEDEPIYVNVKQYHAILRRREARARLEAQNKLVKARKPYLHESRHLHAMKRARGSGGRFLNKKDVQQSELSATTQGIDSRSARLHLGGSLSESEVLRAENSNVATSATCSDVTSVSNNDGIFHKANVGLFGFHSYMRGSLQHEGGVGAQHQVSVIR